MASMTAKRLICTGSAAVLAFSAVLASGLDFQHQLAIGVALAGNGNGHSGGNGGGHGNGNGNGNGHSNALSGNGGGRSGPGKGKGKGASITIVKHEATKHGATASALGALNASHASATALAHASPNSEVGKINAYKQAVMTYQANPTYQVDLDTYKTALLSDPTCNESSCQGALAQVTADLATVVSDLQAAANKPITPNVVTAVDANLGLSVDPVIEAAIAAGASP